MPNNIPPLGTREYLVALRDTARSEISAMRMVANKLAAFWVTDSEGNSWPVLVTGGPSFFVATSRNKLLNRLEDHGFKDVEVRTEW